MERILWKEYNSKLKAYNKTMNKNLSILFETVSTIRIVGKPKGVHPICDVLLKQDQLLPALDSLVFSWKSMSGA